MTAIAQGSQLPVLSTGSLEKYLNSIQQLPILNVEEERDLFERFQCEQDLTAARHLVMSHLRYVVHIARGYVGYGLPLEDLIQQGNVGLMKSVKRFDLSRGTRLVSFAVHWIKAEIHEYILKNWKIVKIATTKAQRKLFFNLRKAKERLDWFTREEVHRVAEDLGVKPEEVLEMESRLTTPDASFDPAPAQEEEELSVSPSAWLTQGEAEDPSSILAGQEISERQHEGLLTALESLDDRSRDIVESRWLREEKASLKVLAEKHGVSLERVRQIEASAFKAMQPCLADI